LGQLLSLCPLLRDGAEGGGGVARYERRWTLGEAETAAAPPWAPRQSHLAESEAALRRVFVDPFRELSGFRVRPLRYTRGARGGGGARPSEADESGPAEGEQAEHAELVATLRELLPALLECWIEAQPAHGARPSAEAAALLSSLAEAFRATLRVLLRVLSPAEATALLNAQLEPVVTHFLPSFGQRGLPQVNLQVCLLLALFLRERSAADDDAAAAAADAAVAAGQEVRDEAAAEPEWVRAVASYVCARLATPDELAAVLEVASVLLPRLRGSSQRALVLAAVRAFTAAHPRSQAKAALFAWLRALWLPPRARRWLREEDVRRALSSLGEWVALLPSESNDTAAEALRVLAAALRVSVASVDGDAAAKALLRLLRGGKDVSALATRGAAVQQRCLELVAVVPWVGGELLAALAQFALRPSVDARVRLAAVEMPFLRRGGCELGDLLSFSWTVCWRGGALPARSGEVGDETERNTRLRVAAALVRAVCQRWQDLADTLGDEAALRGIMLPVLHEAIGVDAAAAAANSTKLSDHQIAAALLCLRALAPATSRGALTPPWLLWLALERWAEPAPSAPQASRVFLLEALAEAGPSLLQATLPAGVERVSADPDASRRLCVVVTRALCEPRLASGPELSTLRAAVDAALESALAPGRAVPSDTLEALDSAYRLAFAARSAAVARRGGVAP
jgi:hypothetical protein